MNLSSYEVQSRPPDEGGIRMSACVDTIPIKKCTVKVVFMDVSRM